LRITNSFLPILWINDLPIRRKNYMNLKISALWTLRFAVTAVTAVIVCHDIAPIMKVMKVTAKNQK
jgi:hypothetical protein